MSNKRPLCFPPISSEQIEMLPNTVNIPTYTEPNVTISVPTEPVTTRRKRFGRLNAGGRCFSVFLFTILCLGLMVQTYRIGEVRDFKVGTVEWWMPLFTLISVMSNFGSAILYGRPYSGFAVSGVCLLLSIPVYKIWPGLMDWWDGMSTLFGLLAVVVEYFFYWNKYGRDD